MKRWLILSIIVVGLLLISAAILRHQTTESSSFPLFIFQGASMKRLTFASLLCIFLLTAFSFKALAQTKLGPKDGAGLPAADLNRIRVGEEAPDFTLEDKDGKPVTLSSYRGQKSVVLVFYRGYW
jgi:hypothetical protein